MRKPGSKILHGLLMATSGLVASTFIASTAAIAGGGPTGGHVAVGSATIVNASPTQTVVNQSSKKALINWNSFSVPYGSQVKFNQPNAKSLTVNRVTGPNASAIDGQLLANGNIWLINANGIMFGQGSQVNVGALLATTSDISDSDFKAGNYAFKPAANPNASVVNKGTLTASANGSIVLSAPHVANKGLIQANLGTVVLGGAKAFTVDLDGDNLLRYQVTAPVTDAPKTANGSVASALVSNSGTIEADGGRVVMTARAAKNIQDNVINNTGIVEATSISAHNGEIDLDAGSNGTVDVRGTLDASGAASGLTGGTVKVTGGTVEVKGGANIDVSGDAGGGTILLGGDAHGKGALAHARRTRIGNATITADAVTTGNGGNIVIWSDKKTFFDGNLSAQGGSTGGDGGNIETSGGSVGLGAHMHVDALAAKGKTGNWLLDPTDILITNDTNQSVCCGTATCLTPDQITTGVASANFQETATNSLVVDTSSDIDYSSSNSLTLNAGTFLTVNSQIENSGSGAINLKAAGGNLTINAPISTLGSGALDSFEAGDSINILAPIDAGADELVLHAGEATTDGIPGAIIDENADVLTADKVRLVNDKGGTSDQTIGTSDHPIYVSTSHLALYTANDDMYVHSMGDVDIGDGSLGVVGHNLTLTAAGNVTQNSEDALGIQLTGNLSVTTTGAHHGISLTDAGSYSGGYYNYSSDYGNQISGTVNLTSAADIAFTNTITTKLGSVSAGGVFDIEVNDANQEDGHSDLLLEGSVTASGTGDSTLHATGDIINVGGASTITADALNLISDYGSLAAPEPTDPDTTYFLSTDVNSLHAETGTEGGILLTNAGSFAIGTDEGGFDIGTAGGYVGAANGGNLTQISGTNGEIIATDLGVGGGNFTLTNSNNRVSGNLSLFTTGSGTFTNNGATTLGDVTGSTYSNDTSPAGDITIHVIDGPLSQNGAIHAANLTVDVMTDNDSSPPVTLTNAANNVTGTFTVTAPGEVSFTNNTTITVGYVDGGGGGDDVYPSGDVTLTALHGGINITGGILAGDGDTITLTAPGNIVQAHNSGLDGDNLSVSTNGNIVLPNDNDMDGEVNLSALGNVLFGNNDNTRLAEVSAGGNLTVLSEGNLTITQSIQNSGSGNITLVAGWDGTTTAASQLGNSGVYGNYNANGTYGNVYIDGSLFGVSVGSAGGKTLVEGHDIVLTGGEGWAQIGYAGSGATGAITVRAVRDVSLTAGDGDTECGNECFASPYAQIGNGGVELSGPDSGAITVQAGGNITLNAGGSTYSYAQIGNGGDTGSHNDSGNITVTAGASISLTGGTDYAQIGNGGWGSNGSSGAVTVTAAGDITLTGADNSPWGYTQIGDGGQFSTGIANGTVVVTANGTVTLTAGHHGMYAQIGNGGNQLLGYGSTGNSAGGNVTVNAVNISMTGYSNASGADDYAQIGNTAITANGTVTAGGNVVLNVTGTTSIDSAAGGDVVWIGNRANGGTETGAVNIRTFDLVLTGDDDDSFSQSIIGDLSGGTVLIGETDASSTTHIDDLDYSSANNLSILTAGDLVVNGDLVNSGSGNITVVTGWNPSISPSTVATASGGFGNHNATLTVGGATASGNAELGSASGTTTVLTGNLNVDSEHGYAQIGYHGAGTGNIVVDATGATKLLSTYFVSQIGNGGTDVSGTIGGNISLNNGGSVSVTTATNGIAALIGNVGGVNSSQSGNIAIDANGNLVLSNAGSGNWTYGSLTRIGNFAYGGTTGTSSGNIAIDAAALSASATGGWALTEIGTGTIHAGVDSGAINGNITINTGALSLTATDLGDDSNDQVRIGNLGYGKVGGNIAITASGNVTLVSNGLGVSSIGSISIPTDSQGNPLQGQGAGNLTLTSGGNVLLNASNGGNARIESTGFKTGNVSVTATGNVTLTAATDASAIIGGISGGDSSLNVAVVSAGGAIDLEAGDTSSVQIGNAWGGVAGNVSGNVTVTASNASHGNITVAASGDGANAQIGNFGDGTATGTVAAVAGNALSMSGTQFVVDGQTVSGSEAVLGNTVLSDVTDGVEPPVAGGGAIIVSAQSFTTTGTPFVAGSSADISLSGSGKSLGSSSAPLQLLVDAVAISTSNANAYFTALEPSLSIGVGNDGIDLGTGSLFLTSSGPVSQTQAIEARALNISSANGGDITLTNSGNAFNTASVFTSGNASLTDGSSLSVSSATVGGTLTLASAGSIGQTGAISAGTVNAAANGGDITLTNSGNTIGTASLTATGNASLTDASALTISGANVAGTLTLVDTGTIGQSGAITVGTLNANGTSITLTNSGNTIGTASLTAAGNASLTDASALTISGANVAGTLTLVDTGTIGQSGAITAGTLNANGTSITLTNSGNAFNTASVSTSGNASLTDGSSLSVSSAAVGGTLTLASAGSIGQTGAISAGTVNAAANGGDITLTNSGNAFNTASVSTSGNASLTDGSSLSVSSATVGGTLTLASAGSISQTGAISADELDATANGGDMALKNASNAISNASLTASGAVTFYDGTDLNVTGGSAGGDFTVLDTGSISFLSSIQLGSGALLAVAGWDGTTTAPASLTDTGAYGNHGGSITVGGAGASGNVAIGSASGTTTLAGETIKVDADNGYAQIGYHGAGTGAISVITSGDLIMTAGDGTGDYAQIGDGGYKVGGSTDANINVAVSGDLALNGGDGQEAYVQIGNGGAESNSNTHGYDENGDVSVSAHSVVLNAGSGDASYAQIGDGGYKAGEGLDGTTSIGGNITVASDSAVHLLGGGTDAYAQIGNGGDLINNNVADGSSGEIVGDISVNSTTLDVLLTAGAGGNAYAQIGNGGQGENTPVSGGAVNFTISGTIQVADLTVTGSDTGANAYGQVGNGDASKTGTGDVSGTVTLGNGVTLVTVNGKAPGASANFGNVTGNGTATGTLPKPTGVNDPATIGSVASVTQNSSTPTNGYSVVSLTTPPPTDISGSGIELGGNTTSQGPTPLEQLSDASDSEGEQASDSVAQSVGKSLDGGKTIYVTSKTLIPGVLKQVVTMNANNPHGIPPADVDYSSWGNEALWRW